jgi:hypothetical protein
MEVVQSVNRYGEANQKTVYEAERLFRQQKAKSSENLFHIDEKATNVFWLITKYMEIK